MALSLLGMGTAVPKDFVSQEQSLEIARKLVGSDPSLHEMLERLYPKTQIARRHIGVAPKLVSTILDRGAISSRLATRLREDGNPTTVARLENASEVANSLAEEAARQALAESGRTADEVTHLITVSSTVGSAPGVDTELIQRLGLPCTVERTNVGMMMCSAAINGLRIANSFATADPSAVVLMCVWEICSVHYDLDPQPKKLVSNAIFADGAAALVGIGDSNLDWRVETSGGCLVHSSRDNLRVAIGDHGLDIRLSSKVPGLIEEHLRPLVDKWLAESGLKTHDIRSWAVHPGGPKILQATAGALDLADQDLAASWEVLERYGNMSSPTVLFVLEKLRREEAPLPCVAIAYGPGMTVELALIRPEAHAAGCNTRLASEGRKPQPVAASQKAA